MKYKNLVQSSGDQVYDLNGEEVWVDGYLEAPKMVVNDTPSKMSVFVEDKPKPKIATENVKITVQGPDIPADSDTILGDDDTVYPTPRIHGKKQAPAMSILEV